MFNSRLFFLASTLVGLGLVGCATPVKEQEQTGFLSDYSNLEKVDDQAYSYISPKVTNYQQFIIDPVAMLYEPSEDDPEFSDAELEGLKTYLVTELTKAMTKNDGYEIVEEPGPGVGRFRVGITQVDATIGALNVVIYTKITGAGLGGVAIEGEIVDSMNGEQLGATLRWGSGSRVLRAGYTKMGDAEILLKRWSNQARKNLDAMRDAEN